MTSLGLSGKDHLPQLADSAAQDTISFWCKGTMLACIKFGVHQDPRDPFYIADFQSVGPSLYQCVWLFLPSCRTFQFSLFNLMRFLSAHFSNLLWSLQVAVQLPGVCTTPLSFVSSAELLRVHSALSSRSRWLALYTLLTKLSWTIHETLCRWFKIIFQLSFNIVLWASAEVFCFQIKLNGLVKMVTFKLMFEVRADHFFVWSIPFPSQTLH